MDKDLEKLLQSISDYLGCKIACARSPEYEAYYFYAFLTGEPVNSVEYLSKNTASSLNVDGYNAVLEEDEDGEHLYSIGTYDEIFILPFKVNNFETKIITPKKNKKFKKIDVYGETKIERLEKEKLCKEERDNSEVKKEKDKNKK